MAKLAEYRSLGGTGLRVSPLCLGTMTFGDRWAFSAPPAVRTQILDRYAERGGNFLDVSRWYDSEAQIGEALSGRRNRFVISTTFTCSIDPEDVNAAGNQRRALRRALESSLRQLRTDFIDILLLHVWDFRTNIDEVMRVLDDAVRAGHVLHLAASFTPAWVVAHGNTLASLRGQTPFSIMQARYSLMDRSAERDVIPMAQCLGLELMPYEVLGTGLLTGKYTRDDVGAPTDPADKTRRPIITKKGYMTERNIRIVEEVSAIAAELSRPASHVALAWVRQRPVRPIPIIGARTLEQLDENLDSLDFKLGASEIERLDAVSAIEFGYPHDLYAREAFMQDHVDGGPYVEGGYRPLYGLEKAS